MINWETFKCVEVNTELVELTKTVGLNEIVRCGAGQKTKKRQTKAKRLH